MELFLVNDIKLGIKKLANFKVSDIDKLQAEFLKWGVVLLAPCVKGVFKSVNQYGS